MLPFQFKVDSAPANLVWAASVQVIEKFAGYAVIAVLTRTLLPVDIGKMFFAATISGIAATILSFGSEHHLIRAVASEPRKALQNLGEVLTMRLQNLVLVYAVVNLVFWRLEPALSPALLLVTAYDFIEELYYAFSSFFTGQKRMVYTLAIGAILKILTAVAISAVAYLTRALQPVLLTYVVLDVVLVATTFLVVRRDFGPVHLTWQWRRSLELMRVSLPFFLFNILTIVHLRLDTLMVGFILSLVQVAYYDLGMRMLEVARLVIRPFYSVFYPIFAEMAVQGQWKRLRRQSVELVATAFSLGVLVTIGVEVVLPWVIVLLFGSEYRASIIPTRVLFLSLPFIYCQWMLTLLANSLHLERTAAWLLGASTALNLSLNLIVIPRYGIVGAAWTTLASQMFLTASLLWATAARLFKPEPV